MKPLVTVGVVSCNRLHYLRALMESAKQCIDYENLEWIVIDNCSTEAGLQDYIRSLDFVSQKIFREERNPATEHLSAMNEIVATSASEYIMLLPDDMQFILKGDWLADIINILDRNDSIGSVVLDAQRRSTLRDNFPSRILFRRGPKKITADSGREFLSYGKHKVGIVPAGIGSVTRTSVWRTLGPWKATGDQVLGDSTGGGEDNMLNRYRHADLKLERVLPSIPVAAGIFTPQNNVQAYVRGNRRFGNYFKPPASPYYYEIHTDLQANQRARQVTPLSFEEIVVPIGFEHRYDEMGGFIKPVKSECDQSELIAES